MDDAVRARAYLLWEADGRPDGRAEHYWQMALVEAEPAKGKRASSAKAAAPAAERKSGKKAKA
jgi:hypothetical protein